MSCRYCKILYCTNELQLIYMHAKGAERARAESRPLCKSYRGNVIVSPHRRTTAAVNNHIHRPPQKYQIESAASVSKSHLNKRHPDPPPIGKKKKEGKEKGKKKEKRRKKGKRREERENEEKKKKRKEKKKKMDVGRQILMPPPPLSRGHPGHPFSSPS